MLAVSVLLTLSPWNLGPFTRVSKEPALQANPNIPWESGAVFNPAATTWRHKVLLFPWIEDSTGEGIGGHVSRIGRAVSDDGETFKLDSTPILGPTIHSLDWPGGCEDPRVCQAPNGGLVMTYTSWDRHTARLSVATSTDGLKWSKHGAAFSGLWANQWSKSGSIVCKRKGDALVASRIGGHYWMYWGEGQVKVATSNDLIHWSPIEKKGSLLVVLSPRIGEFDSELCEPGPPAISTPRGVVLLYNGKNAATQGDPKLGPGAYSAGQALFSGSDPTNLIARLDHPFLKPELQSEKSGQYAAGTVFIEGLAFRCRTAYLYYGMADSRVGVAKWVIPEGSFSF